MRALPQQPETANIRALAQVYRERFTGLTGTTITLQHVVTTTQFGDEGLEHVFKNGVLLDPTTYTIRGKVITLGSAAVGTDVFIVYYHYRTGV
jgi:hypothetical protein